MRRLLVGVATSLVSALASCTVLTSLDGLAGPPSRAEPPLPGIDGSVDGDAGPPPDGALPDGAPPPGTRVFLTVVGGSGATAASPDVLVTEVLESGALTGWKSAPGLPQGRQRGTVAAAANHVWVLGGDSPTGFASTALGSTIAGPSIGGWLAGPPLPTAIFRHGSFVSGGRIYVAGGASGGAPLSDVVTAEVRGATLGPWQAATSLPAGRSGAVILASRGHAYVLTGTDATSQGTGDGWVSTISADGGLEPWLPVTAVGVTTNAAAGAATDHHVYVSGGYASANNAAIRAAAIQPDGSLGPWFAAGTMLTGRAGHSVAIARGRFYVIAGTDGTDMDLASVEVADVLADGTLSAFRASTPLPRATSFAGVAVVTEP